MKILFVCLGNICRSPLAEGIFKKLLKEAGLEGKVTADSCATSNYHIGDPPDDRTIENAESHGITLDHVGRQLTRQDFYTFDLILTMDRSIYDDTIRLAPSGEVTKKVRMMRDFDNDPGNREVPDPYYGGQRLFEEVYMILARSCEGVLEYVQEEMEA
jgi:protein-tyrosine phosphatase